MADYTGIFEMAIRAGQYLEQVKLEGMILQLRNAALVGEVAALASGAIPVLAWGGVWAALGSGYLGARTAVENENFARGYSQGFVMGLLDWEWGHVRERFGVAGIIRSNHFDATLDEVKAKAYAFGLSIGFQVAKDISEDRKKAFLSGLRKHANAVRGDWTRNEQISYVIELSTVYRTKFMQR